MTFGSLRRTNSCSGQPLLWPSLPYYVRASSPHHFQFTSTRWYTCPAQTSVLPPTDLYRCTWNHPKLIPSGWAVPLRSPFWSFGLCSTGNALLPGSPANRQFQPPLFLLIRAFLTRDSTLNTSRNLPQYSKQSLPSWPPPIVPHDKLGIQAQDNVDLVKVVLIFFTTYLAVFGA